MVKISLLKYSLFLLLLFYTSRLLAETNAYEKSRVLFLLTQGELAASIDQYHQLCQTQMKHDYDLLQQMSLLILDTGIKSEDQEEQLLAIFGAAIANNDRSYYILEEGLRSSHPQIQYISLNFISKTENDHAFESINKLMNSPYALMRLEAALQLAIKKHPRATAQVEALMQKIDPIAWPLFPRLLAMIGDEPAIKILKKLLSNSDPNVRIASILSAVEYKRDDLLAQVRKLAAQHDVRVQEAAAYALGEFKDQTSIPLLMRLSKSQHPTVQLAALQSLYLLGVKEAFDPIQKCALTGNVFAIQVLRQMPEGKNALYSLLASPSLQVRINATVALLELKDPRVVPALSEILIRSVKDLAFTQISTQGRALTALKAVPSSAHQENEAAVLQELSLGFREEILEKTLENLPKDCFLKIASEVFEKKQNELIPLLVNLLVSQDSEEGIQLLKTQQQKAGAPLIRIYSTLALFKIKEDETFGKSLKEWVVRQQEVEILKFREVVPLEFRDSLNTYELTPIETAKLLVESLETLIEHDDEKGIDLLLQVLKEGHKRNQSLLAGLILRAVQ